MTLLGIELGTLGVKGEWSDHYTTEAPGFGFTNRLRNRRHKVRTLRRREVSRTYIRERSIHRARRRVLQRNEIKT